MRPGDDPQRIAEAQIDPRRQSGCWKSSGEQEPWSKVWHIPDMVVVDYESIKRELKTKPIHEFRCDERLKTRVEESCCCLLWIDKARAKDKMYIWVSVWWKNESTRYFQENSGHGVPGSGCLHKSFEERKDSKGKDTFDLSDWWKSNCATLPGFAYVLRAVLTNSPNSCPPERLFSLFNATYNDDQKSSYTDYIELSM